MRVKLHRRVLVTMCESRTDKGIEKERGEQGRIVGRRGKTQKERKKKKEDGGGARATEATGTVKGNIGAKR